MGAEVIEPHGLIMVLEPLSDTPELFLRYSGQIYSICKAVDSPSCKLLYDAYHMQRNEGNLINSMERHGKRSPISRLGTILAEKNLAPVKSTTKTCSYTYMIKVIKE